MKAGCVPYWPCGGEVLTRCLTADGRLAARAVGAAEAAGLLDFYGEAGEGAALRIACAKAEDWRRASGLNTGCHPGQAKREPGPSGGG